MDYYRAVDAVLTVSATLNATNGTSGDMFAEMSPYFFGMLGASIAIAISVLGAAWYVLLHTIINPYDSTHWVDAQSTRRDFISSNVYFALPWARTALLSLTRHCFLSFIGVSL